MDDDRKLLELAAEAAGKSIRWDGDVCVLTDPDWSHDKCSAWNPLTDDGDALRLAVKLRINVCQSEHGEEADGEPYAWARIGGREFDEGGPDLNAATRRAIVRAAAALKEKP